MSSNEKHFAKILKRLFFVFCQMVMKKDFVLSQKNTKCLQKISIPTFKLAMLIAHIVLFSKEIFDVMAWSQEPPPSQLDASKKVIGTIKFCNNFHHIVTNSNTLKGTVSREFLF